MEGKLRSASLMFHSDWHDKMWDNLLYSIQTGKPAFEKVQGEPAFDWFGKNPEQAELFHKANAYKAASSHRVIAETYNFKGINTITDVGGGLGSLMVEILKAHPHLKAVVAELPEVIEQVKQTIRQNSLENRMKAVECDFFNDIPEGSDVYLLSHVLHDWPDDKCIDILNNCRKTEARLLIIEAVIPDGNTFSVSKLLDLEVLLMGRG
ncbi:methyltransferase, partial [Desulfobacterales bacterium HSG17]|nr:methyltransferase [Desulfobacterales bacterium HSG17]